MADVTVVHYDLNARGGGEAVCMNVLDALQDEHDLSLLMASEVTDWDGLNEYFGTNVGNVDTQTMSLAGFDLASLVGALERVGYFTSLFRHAAFNRYCRQASADTDLLLSTWNEISVDVASIQYIHFPQLYQRMTPTDAYEDRRAVRAIVHSVTAIARAFAGFDESAVGRARLLANSAWTARYVEEYYGRSPSVLNPPIDTAGLSPSPAWEQRENGFVFLSRIAPEKNIPWLVEILREVRNRGHEIHFHIVGPRDSNAPEHYDRIKSLARQYNFVSLEGPMHGEPLREMLSQHRYGINGATSEQFGMAIAEMVAAGMIPFVPNSGGQRELVNENPAVLFDTTADAVKKISDIVSDQKTAERVKKTFPNIAEKYGKAAFQEQIRDYVREELER